ncbi:MAG: TIR domain-containing protein [Rikenellaceae bacterium]|nr:TIR domain-containing protein [Rikenellaceae bacterium]
MKYDVFISYSSHDQKVVEGLCAYLESLKIRCFVAYRDIPKSVVWAKAIVEALEQSRMMVVVFSNHFNNSVQVDREIELASEDNKPILTFRITDDAFKGAKKYYLKNINWIDAFPNPAACFGNLADHIAKLLGIKLIAPQPQTPAPTTSPAVLPTGSVIKPVSKYNKLPQYVKKLFVTVGKIAFAVTAFFGAIFIFFLLKPDKAKETKATYSIGDYYNENGKEGVVFEVSADGRSGKIVSMKQSAERLQWSSDEAEQNRLIGADSETDGAYNSAKVKAISGWQSKYPAFKWCADLGEDWYLPSIEELRVFTLNTAVHDAVNRTLIARGGTKLYNRGEWKLYWSSTEYDKQYDGEFCAWRVYMYRGNAHITSKRDLYYVRAVSAF